MRSRWLSMLWFLGVLLMLPLPISAQVKGLKKVHVGVPAISMGNIIIYFSKEAKIYEKHGLDVDPVAVAGSGIASKALISGSVQISPITTPTVMSSGTRRRRHGDLGPHDAGRDSIPSGAVGY